MRVSILKVNPNILLEICKYGIGHFRIVANALPSDTVYVKAFTDDKGQIGLLLESQSFRDIDGSEQIPTLVFPQFEKVN